MSAPAFNRAVLSALGIAVAGALACAIGLLIEPTAVAAGWLWVALLLLGLPLGSLTVLMLHTLTGGAWGEPVRQPLRAILATLPLGLLFLLPLMIGLQSLYPWTAAAETLSEVARHKLAYLNLPFFLARFGVYCLVWLGLAWAVLGWTIPPAATHDDPAFRNRRKIAATGLILHGLTVTFFSVDWMMSLEPEFYSTIYPMIEAAGQVAGAYAVALLIVAFTKAVEAQPGGGEGVALSEDIANLLFGFTLMWVYLAFMQWLIIWAADLPREIHWYLVRVAGGWKFILWLLVLLHFVVPFAAFLNREIKRTHAGLIALGAVVFAAHLIDVFWRIRPALGDKAGAFGWTDIAALAGAGGLWLALVLVLLERPHLMVLRPGGGHHA